MADASTIAPAGLRLEVTEHGVAVIGTPDAYRAVAARLTAAAEAAEAGKPLPVDLGESVTKDSDPFEVDAMVVHRLEPRPTAPPEHGCAWAGWVFFSGIVLLVILAAVGAGAIFVYFKG